MLVRGQRRSTLFVMLAALICILGLGLVVVSVVKNNARKRESTLAWSAAAAQLGCRFDAPKGSGAFARIEGKIDGANVVGYAAVETAPTTRVTGPAPTYGSTSSIITSAAATADDIPPGFLVRIQRRGEAGADASTDVIEVKTGHEAFDAAFTAQANAPVLLRRILRPDLIDQLLALPRTQFVVREQEARVSRAGTLTDAATITSMMRASSALARGASEVLASWKDLAARVGGVLEAGDSWTKDSRLPAIAVERGGVAFRIEASAEGEVEICGSHQGDPLRLRIDPALAADARMRPTPPTANDAAGAVRFRVAAAPSDVESALDLLASSAAESAYR